MIASEYKNCFWNASGDLSCPTPGYQGPRASEYPNWKLYNNIVAVEPFNNKGYQTDYETAHIGTRTTDHYYQQQPYVAGQARTQSTIRPQVSQRPRRQIGGVNKYTQYKYQQPYFRNNELEDIDLQRLRWLQQEQIHCQQQFGGQQGGQGASQMGGDYDSSMFTRPNMHGLGGNGWGDSQIMQEAINYTDNCDATNNPAYNNYDINDGYSVIDQQPPIYDFEPPRHNHHKMRQGKLTSYGYSYSATNPEIEPMVRPAAGVVVGEMQSRYQIPTYINDYYKKCDEPNPADMTARQQYDNMLSKYNDPNLSTQLGYPYNPSSISGVNGVSGGLAGSPYNNNFQITNNSEICYNAYNKKGEPVIQAPSYATILMNERPYLNPNPYGMYQLPGDNIVLPYNANNNALSTYNQFNSMITNPITASNANNGYNGNNGYNAYMQQGGYVKQSKYGNCPGQELISKTEASFRERLGKMLNEIGEPMQISKGKNNIRAVWQGATLHNPYRKCFHRVYLNNNDPYPVMTVARIKPIDENTQSKLKFVCDRFKVSKIGKDTLLILRGPSFKSNLAKTALALSAIKGKISFCKIYDDELGKKWVWALNPASKQYYDTKAKNNYSKICSSLAKN